MQKIFILSIKSYREQGLVHTKLGKKVGWKEIRISQRHVTAVSRGFNNAFQVGTNGIKGATKRVWDNYISYACILPVLKVLPVSQTT